jgi:hypothetical protein
LERFSLANFSSSLEIPSTSWGRMINILIFWP